MTQRYAHHCPESLRGEIEVLEKVDLGFDYRGGKQKCINGLKLL